MMTLTGATTLALFFISSFFAPTDSSNILALLATPSPSHSIWNTAYVEGLLSKGHRVWIISPDAIKIQSENFTQIKIEGTHVLGPLANFEAMSGDPPHANYLLWANLCVKFCDIAMTPELVDRILKISKQQPFDLVVLEITFIECFTALIPSLNHPPSIAVTAFSHPMWASTMTGNPIIPSYYPDAFTDFTSPMTLFQRLQNSLFYLFIFFHRKLVHLPSQENIARKTLGNSFMSLEELEKNVSLVMINTFNSFDYPRPLLPSVIEVGGLQVLPRKPLPSDVKEFLDGAKNGAILLALGTNVRSSKMTNEKVQALVEAFSELPQRVIWKWESDILEEKPKNVMIKQWLPQNDILAHPNIKIFISHSGLLSTHEAISNAVPIIGIPFMADQHININKLVKKGVALRLDYETITKDKVLSFIHEILTNTSYKEKISEESRLFKDRLNKPLDTAIFWTEYVIRNNGARHLRSPTLDMPFYQVLLIDVIILFTALLVGIIFAIHLCLVLVGRLLISKCKKKKE